MHYIEPDGMMMHLDQSAEPYDDREEMPPMADASKAVDSRRAERRRIALHTVSWFFGLTVTLCVLALLLYVIYRLVVAGPAVVVCVVGVGLLAYASWKLAVHNG